MMEPRILGPTGIRVSSLCFGTMSFGDVADEAMSAAMYRRCREVGINFFDCANVYSAGRAEEILGRLIAGERNDVVISTKVGFPMGGLNDRGLSRRNILQSVDASLKRLGTDRVEILFVHTFDPETPMEETLSALDHVVRQGKVLHVGASNWAAWQVALALGLSRGMGLVEFVCIQPMYSLVKRQAEVELLPLAEAEGLGATSYSPLGGGLLSGRYGASRRPAHGRLVDNAMYKARYGDPIHFEVAESFVALANDLGVHPATLAVSWVLHNPGITAPIIGARNVEQLEASLAAPGVPMNDELYTRIAELSPTPPSATDRAEEQRGVRYSGSAEKY